MAGEALGACVAFSCAAFVLLFVFSFASVAPTEMALKYNYVFKTVSPTVVTNAGLRFVGPFTSLLRYPKTIQTMEYSSVHRDLLDGRTHDGLPLLLGLSFQYRLLQDDNSLINLYHSFEQNTGDYVKIYFLTGMHMITEMATNFTAYQFFNEKQVIANKMRLELDDYFQRNLFATVDSLQINDDDLPSAFTDSVLRAATKKQEIAKMAKTRDARLVEFQTARQVAEAQANVTVAQASGQRHRILQDGRASAAVIEAYVQAEKQAYKEIKDTMGLSSGDLVNYIWYDTLSGGSVSTSQSESSSIQLMVGVDPATYISEVRP